MIPQALIPAILIISALLASPARAENPTFEDQTGMSLTVELIWETPVDLDLFLTDPGGETVYFANRIAKSGAKMGAMLGCEAVGNQNQKFLESVHIPAAQAGRYRVSVDFIKDCGNSILEAEFSVILKNKEGAAIGNGQSEVQYRLLNPVGWEFWIE